MADMKPGWPKSTEAQTSRALIHAGENCHRLLVDEAEGAPDDAVGDRPTVANGFIDDTDSSLREKLAFVITDSGSARRCLPSRRVGVAPWVPPTSQSKLRKSGWCSPLKRVAAGSGDRSYRGRRCL